MIGTLGGEILHSLSTAEQQVECENYRAILNEMRVIETAPLMKII